MFAVPEFTSQSVAATGPNYRDIQQVTENQGFYQIRKLFYQNTPENTMAQKAHSSVVIFHSSVVIFHSSVVIFHSSVVIFIQFSCDFHTVQL